MRTLLVMHIDRNVAIAIAVILVVAAAVIVITSGESVAVRFLTIIVSIDIAVRLVAHASRPDAAPRPDRADRAGGLASVAHGRRAHVGNRGADPTPRFCVPTGVVDRIRFELDLERVEPRPVVGREDREVLPRGRFAERLTDEHRHEHRMARRAEQEASIRMTAVRPGGVSSATIAAVVASMPATCMQMVQPFAPPTCARRCASSVGTVTGSRASTARLARRRGSTSVVTGCRG